MESTHSALDQGHRSKEVSVPQEREGPEVSRRGSEGGGVRDRTVTRQEETKDTREAFTKLHGITHAPSVRDIKLF